MKKQIKEIEDYRKLNTVEKYNRLIGDSKELAKILWGSQRRGTDAILSIKNYLIDLRGAYIEDYTDFSRAQKNDLDGILLQLDALLENRLVIAKVEDFNRVLGEERRKKENL